jgi:phosphoribosylaminoimidazole carboxylase (NCAIR synthetase)
VSCSTPLPSFYKGDISDFDAVYRFGKPLDAITIEIENVNIDALEKLRTEGVKDLSPSSCIKNHQRIRSFKRNIIRTQISPVPV